MNNLEEKIEQPELIPDKRKPIIKSNKPYIPDNKPYIPNLRMSYIPEIKPEIINYNP